MHSLIAFEPQYLTQSIYSSTGPSVLHQLYPAEIRWEPDEQYQRKSLRNERGDSHEAVEDADLADCVLAIGSHPITSIKS